jgi:GNAT superfamily N-acetyltransferase
LPTAHLGLDKLTRLWHGDVASDDRVRREDVLAVAAWDFGPMLAASHKRHQLGSRRLGAVAGIERLCLRRAVGADAEAVRALTRAAYAKWVPMVGREPLPMTADYDQAVTNHIIDLLEEDGNLRALIEMALADGHLLIVNIAVRPDQQGQGVGGRLLEHAECFARSLGLEEIRLYTNAMMASNLKFYGRRGYQEFRRGTIVPGTVSIFMRKKISLPDCRAEPS